MALSLPSFVSRLLSPFRSAKPKRRGKRAEGAGKRADGKRADGNASAKAANREANREAKRQSRLAEREAGARLQAERTAAREAKQAAKAAARRAGRTFQVVSFPKSGRTWLRVMLDGLKLDAKYTHDGSGHSRTGHVEEIEPASDAFAGKTIVFLYRDPRDTVVSGYFQTAKRLGGYDGTISDFVRDPRHGIEKIVRFNMEWLARGSELGRFHPLTYEDLKADTAGTLASIVGFVGAERRADEIATAVDEASFEKMQARERSGELAERYGRILAPADDSDPQSYKVREGIVGGFRKHLGAEDVAYCDEVIARLGYPLERHGSADS